MEFLRIKDVFLEEGECASDAPDIIDEVRTKLCYISLSPCFIMEMLSLL